MNIGSAGGHRIRSSVVHSESDGKGSTGSVVQRIKGSGDDTMWFNGLVVQWFRGSEEQRKGGRRNTYGGVVRTPTRTVVRTPTANYV
jgi:hypothetical protein